ncbi:hypothetical protein [Streptomyces albidus (ex Kaewkla and Franco 2022)]|uniref:hypothetical protein n=1 Tax=Streptomyces albidus (ex Kaewkla and Franco 2022) TaxID=722709 RepID=UPI001F1EE9AE|nr:hypothetical protein [Streptomyces albidus (ex Kaewkla and Franco 2022)]
MTTTHATRTAHGTATRTAPMTSPLAIYLNDHLMGATSGSELARRIAKQHAMSAAGQTLVRIADEVAQDRASLLRIMGELGVPARRYKVAAGWMAEKAGRAKTNGFLVRRSPLSSVIELETLRLGIEGKRLMWQGLLSLSTIAPQDGLDAELLTKLLQRAEDQAEVIEELRLRAASDVLKPA